MILQWYMAGPDAAASYDEFVFRIHKSTVEKKFTYIEEKVSFDIFKLQIREKKRINFKDLGYTFFIEPPSDFAREFVIKNSLNNRAWQSLDEIVEEVEDILCSLEFIPSSKPTPIEGRNIQLLSAASQAFIASLKDKKYLRKNISENSMRFLEDMLLRGLSHYIVGDKTNLFDSEDIIPQIALAEFEIDLTIAMSEPDMYHIGGWKEAFDSQKYLHDEDWLEEHLVEKSLNLDDDIITLDSFQSFPFKVTNEIIFEQLSQIIGEFLEEEIVVYRYDDFTYSIFCGDGSLNHFFEEHPEFLEQLQKILPDGEEFIIKEATTYKSDEREYDFQISILYITKDKYEYRTIEKDAAKLLHRRNAENDIK